MQNKCRDVSMVLLVSLNLMCFVFKLSKICSIEFLEKGELERCNLCLELYKLSKKLTEGNTRYSCSFFGISAHATSYFFPIIN